MTQPRRAKINRIGAPFGTSMNRPNDFWFSSDLKDWIQSKRLLSNRKIVDWTRNYRLKKSA